MPPKPKAVSKADTKKKEKIVEDKTFGLKNKKGTKQQKFIQQVHQQVKGQQLKDDEQKRNKLTAKEKQKKELDELNDLFKPVLQQQKIEEGVDPKSVLCVYFKSGKCQKGFKCKFSHDLNVERKSEKRNVYELEDTADNMDDWDEAKLEEVIEKKHGSSNMGLTSTTIICKFFLEAVENSKYGWFWSCPNGLSCHYKHALPPGFVLKKDMKSRSKEDEISIEELVEKERASLGISVTRVTLETFLKWKERKRNEKTEAAKENVAKKKQDFKSGKCLGISGRELFEFNPDLITGDDDEADDIVTYKKEEGSDDDEYSGPIREIHLDTIMKEETEKIMQPVPSPDTGTNTTRVESHTSSEAVSLPSTNSGLDDEITEKLVLGDVPIDENLFDEDDLDEDLDLLDLEQ